MIIGCHTSSLMFSIVVYESYIHAYIHISKSTPKYLSFKTNPSLLTQFVWKWYVHEVVTIIVAQVLAIFDSKKDWARQLGLVLNERYFDVVCESSFPEDQNDAF